MLIIEICCTGCRIDEKPCSDRFVQGYELAMVVKLGIATAGASNVTVATLATKCSVTLFLVEVTPATHPSIGRF
jgi:hypothetical protein